MAYVGYMLQRLINKLIPFKKEHLEDLEKVTDEIWEFYQELKSYKKLTTEQQREEKARLVQRFDEIFGQSTCFETRLPCISSTEKTKSGTAESFGKT